MVITTPFFCKMADKAGRKNTLLTVGVANSASWLFVAFTQNPWGFYISRMLHGVGDAAIFAALPAYTAEITTPKVRSLYGSMMMVSSFFGQFLANCIGFYFSIPTAGFIMLIFPIIFMISFGFSPNSPYHLVMIGRIDDARNSLRKLRRNNNRIAIDVELGQIIKDVQRQLSESSKFKDLFSISSNRRALFITVISRIFSQLSGFASFVVYSQYIFQEAGGDISSGHSAMIISGILCIVVVFSNFISDKLGRRRSMMTSCLGCGSTLCIQALYFYLSTNGFIDSSAWSWFPVFAIVIYSALYCIGLGIVPTLLYAELFSTGIRKHAASVANIVFGTCVCVFPKAFQIMMSEMGLWPPFLIFSVCCFMSAIASYFIIPETKGKTLEEIQLMLKESCK